MILLIDNYDSFSYNLYQMIGAIDSDVAVVRNDALDVAQIRTMHPDRIVLSPGPGRPEQAGVCMDAASQLADEVPILGVCLGHQAICAAYGATVTYAPTLMHGKQSIVTLDPRCPLFDGLGPTIPAARYHSLAVDPATLPADLHVVAHADDGTIMAVAHADKPLFGLQFHPESILTPDGGRIVRNFLELRS